MLYRANSRGVSEQKKVKQNVIKVHFIAFYLIQTLYRKESVCFLESYGCVQ